MKTIVGDKPPERTGRQKLHPTDEIMVTTIKDIFYILRKHVEIQNKMEKELRTRGPAGGVKHEARDDDDIIRNKK